MSQNAARGGTLLLFALAGLAVGVGLGYAYGGRLRDATPRNIKTDFKDGKASVTFDVKGAAQNALEEWWQGVRGG